DSLIAAIDAAVAGDASVFDKIYSAAKGHMPMTASALAGAISMQFPDKFPGTVDSPGAKLQQDLTDLFDGHVYLASIAISTGLTKGLDSPEFKAAATTLDTNSQDLAAAIESVYGAEAGKAFLKQWRAHIEFFVQYTQGKATGDKAMANAALKKLQNYKEDFAAFLDKATGGELPSDAAAEALQMHVDSLIAAIDAAVAGDASVFDKIYSAAKGHMPMTASALAGAISTQFPDKFPVE
ncbi:MAG: copper amine oxidase, partial [Actinomycetota bacterium]